MTNPGQMRFFHFHQVIKSELLYSLNTMLTGAASIVVFKSAGKHKLCSALPYLCAALHAAT